MECCECADTPQKSVCVCVGEQGSMNTWQRWPTNWWSLSTHALTSLRTLPSLAGRKEKARERGKRERKAVEEATSHTHTHTHKCTHTHTHTPLTPSSFPSPSPTPQPPPPTSISPVSMSCCFSSGVMPGSCQSKILFSSLVEGCNVPK